VTLASCLTCKTGNAGSNVTFMLAPRSAQIRGCAGWLLFLPLQALVRRRCFLHQALIRMRSGS
jgi:hypothetical protein